MGKIVVELSVDGVTLGGNRTGNEDITPRMETYSIQAQLSSTIFALQPFSLVDPFLALQL